MTTDKDAPKSRGIPATQSDAAVREAFAKQVDTDNHGQFAGIAKKTADANQKKAMELMRSVRNKKR